MERHLQSDMTLNPNMIQHLKLSRPNGTIRGVFFTNPGNGIGKTDDITGVIRGAGFGLNES